jgi:hypothetical protein
MRGFTFKIKTNDSNIIKQLVELGACVNQDCGNNTALSHAVEYKYVSMVKTLLELGADPNIKSNCARTYYPLELAVLYNRPDIAKILIDNGADIHNGDYKGFTLESLKLLLSLGMNPNYLTHESVRCDKLDCLKFLVDNGADVNYDKLRSYDMLTSACTKGMNDIIDYLLENGANVDKAFHNCIEYYFDLNIAKRLMKAGARINNCNSDILKHVCHNDIEFANIAIESGFTINKGYLVEKSGFHNTDKVINVLEFILENASTKEVLCRLMGLFEFSQKQLSEQLFMNIDYKDKFELLQQFGADINFVEKGSSTSKVCKLGVYSFKYIKFLLNHGAIIGKEYEILSVDCGRLTELLVKRADIDVNATGAFSHLGQYMSSFLGKEGSLLYKSCVKGWIDAVKAILNHKDFVLDDTEWMSDDRCDHDCLDEVKEYIRHKCNRKKAARKS